jgi:hypothetical protein
MDSNLFLLAIPRRLHLLNQIVANGHQLGILGLLLVDGTLQHFDFQIRLLEFGLDEG